MIRSESSSLDGQVRENGAQHRFELPLGDELIAALYYKVDDEGWLILLHTEVPFQFSGEGRATRLVAGALDLMRATRRKAVIRCPFVSHFMRHHPQYLDLVAG